MTITINKWTAHHNQFIYSLFFYCETKSESFKIDYSSTIPSNGILLNFNDKLIFLDYSDSTNFIDSPEKYEFYFKRSLGLNSQINNVKPLNFQVNFSFRPLQLINKIPRSILKSKSSKIEFIRALDYFSFLTNDSHQSKNWYTYKKCYNFRQLVYF